MNPGAISTAAHAIIVIGIAGTFSLGLGLVWYWLAWAFVIAALTLGIALDVLAARALAAQQREVETVRRRQR